MAGLRRQKISLDDDPLAMLGKQDDAEEDEEYEEPVKVTPVAKTNIPPSKPVEPLPQPVSNHKGAVGVIPEPPAKKKSIFDDEDDDLLIRKTPPPVSVSPPPRAEPVAASVAVSTANNSKVEPTTSPKPTIAEFEGDDLFSYGIPQKETESSLRPAATKVGAQSTNITKPSVAKIDFNKDEEDISDLKVAQILEKEESLDYKLFGRVETSESVQQRVQKRLNDLDKEDDFLRQLDELTAKASAVTTATSGTSTSASGVQSTTSPVSSTAAKSTTDIDISSFDLNAYIAQESSGGGGLFDD